VLGPRLQRIGEAPLTVPPSIHSMSAALSVASGPDHGMPGASSVGIVSCPATTAFQP